jgi:plasmid maintenance system killer protein
MAYPGSNLHLLLPRQVGRWAVKVSGNWRVTFIFKEGHAFEVNYEENKSLRFNGKGKDARFVKACLR